MGDDLLPHSKSDAWEDLELPALPAPTYHFGPKYLGVTAIALEAILTFPLCVSFALTINV